MNDVYILDSNVLTLILKYPRQYPHLLERVSQTPYEQIWISAISVEEALRGAFRLRDQKDNPSGCYKLIAWIVREYAKYQILPYDDEDIRIFEGFSPAIRRGASPQDRRIAATGIRHGYTVVTQNTRDFELTGVQFEDWTAAKS